VFVPGDLGSTPPRTPLYNNRAFGALILLVAVIICLAIVLGLDAAVFVPHNATLAVTKTWQAQHPEAATNAAATATAKVTATVAAPTPSSWRRTRTPEPDNFDLQAKTLQD
jgi:hypothetical protein